MRTKTSRCVFLVGVLVSLISCLHQKIIFDTSKVVGFFRNKMPSKKKDCPHGLQRGIQGDYGKWVKGSKHTEICGQQKWTSNFPCCDNTLTYQLHFVFNFPKFNVVETTETLLKKIKDKNITLIGNSMEHALFEVLYFIIGDSATAVLDHRKRNVRMELNHGQNGTVRLYISANQMLMREPLLKHFITISDILILNFGLHYEKWNIMEYVTYVESMSEMLNASGKTVILRSTTPQHFPAAGGFYHSRLKSVLSECINIPNQAPHPTNIILKAMAEKYGFGFLDEFLLFSPRWDLHYKKGDCTHYCHTSELFYPQITLLLQLL